MEVRCKKQLMTAQSLVGWSEGSGTYSKAEKSHWVSFYLTEVCVLRGGGMKEMMDRHRPIFHPLVYSLKVWNSQSMVRLTPGAQHSRQVSHMGGR